MCAELSTVGGTLEEGQIVVLIIPEEEYLVRLLDIVKELASGGQRICYISLNKPYDTLIKSFGKTGIPPGRFYFVDAITRTAEMPKSVENCEFVSSPGALTELSLTISNILERNNFNYLVFDSLSTLLVYESETVVTKFVHSLMAKIRVVDCKAIFTCLREDAESVLMKDVNMFADKVLRLESWGGRR